MEAWVPTVIEPKATRCSPGSISFNTQIWMVMMSPASQCVNDAPERQEDFDLSQRFNRDVCGHRESQHCLASISMNGLGLF
jgi:hypothetical protein